MDVEEYKMYGELIQRLNILIQQNAEIIKLMKEEDPYEEESGEKPQPLFDPKKKKKKIVLERDEE